jgi:hypothetical protein
MLRTQPRSGDVNMRSNRSSPDAGALFQRLVEVTG